MRFPVAVLAVSALASAFLVSEQYYLTAAATQATAINTHPIEGYTDRQSVAAGEELNFFVSLPLGANGMPRTSYTVQYYRFGASAAVQPASMLGPLAFDNGSNQGYTSTSYVAGAGWTESFDLVVPATWPSGVYAARVVDTAELSAERKEFWITFVVRDPVASQKSIVLLASTNTYHAYNFWPGEGGGDDSGAFYLNCSGGNERTSISFLRPAPSAMPVNIHAQCGPTDPNVTYPRTGWRYFENVRTEHLAAADVRVARWLAGEGLSYSVISDWDLDRDWATDQDLDVLDPAVSPTLVVGSHNEYWSANMVAVVERYLQLGGNVLNLSGNSLYWVVTMAADPVTGNRTIQRGRCGAPPSASSCSGLRRTTTSRTRTATATSRSSPRRTGRTGGR